MAAGRTLTWQAEQEPPTTRATASPCFLSIRRWNSARSRGGISASRLRDLVAGADELLVDRALLGAPVLEPLLVLLGLGGQVLLALLEVRRAPSRSPPRARGTGPRSSGSSFSTPSISFSAAQYSRLDCTLRSCVWYFFCFSLWSASSPSALRFSSSASVSRALERRDGLDLLLELAVDLDEVGRDRVALSFAARGRTGSGSGGGRAGPADRVTPASRSIKKGVPVVDTLRRTTSLSISVSDQKPQNLLAPSSGGSTRIRTGV